VSSGGIVPVRGTVGGDAVDLDDPRLVAGAADVNTDGPERQERLRSLGPLDRRDAVAVEHLLEPKAPDLSKAVGPIEVDVVERHAPRVLGHHDEGGARHGPFDAELGGEALDEAGL